jgi:Fe2+ or Zn2+ uptake regulation protein
MDVWGEVEAGLGSAGKIRILRVMLDKPDQVFTKYALERETGLKPVDVRSNLKTLMEIGWVKEHRYDPKTYEVNMENPVVKHLHDFFKRIKHAK